MFCSYRAKGVKGGGAIILVHSDYKHNKTDEFTFSNDTVERVPIEISQKFRNVVEGCCYRPHTNTNSKEFTEFITEQLIKLNLNLKDCIVRGDFKFYLLKS